MIEHRPRRILLVDDDPSLLVVLAEQLRDDGYEVATARDGQEALRRLEAGWPDLILLDLMMPRVDGLALARRIKAEADLPIIVLSAIDTADSKARLLDEVAEDYVSKPYHYPELRARIQRVLRRLGDRIPRQSLVLGPNLTLDLHRRAATVAGEEVAADADRGRACSRALAANLGEIVPTETLLSRGWTDTEEAEPSYVWVSMRRLRQKIEVDPDRPVHLLTVRGVGYRLVPSRAPMTDRANEPEPSGDATRRGAIGGSVLPSESSSPPALIVAAVVPVAVFGGFVMAAGLCSNGRVDGPASDRRRSSWRRCSGWRSRPSSWPALTAPLRRITAAVERVAAGESSPPIHLTGDDELARLAESHNRIAAESQRRNRELAALLSAIAAYNPAAGVGGAHVTGRERTPAPSTG